jgi:hypothetical protein
MRIAHDNRSESIPSPRHPVPLKAVAESIDDRLLSVLLASHAAQEKRLARLNADMAALGADWILS